MWKYWEIGNVLKVIKDRVKRKFWKLPSVWCLSPKATESLRMNKTFKFNLHTTSQSAASTF